MGKSWVAWTCSAIAPWCLAVGLVVSFVAEAGQELPLGASAEAKSSHGLAAPGDLVPQARASLAHATLGLAAFSLASYGTGASPGSEPFGAGEIIPKTEFKRFVRLGSDGRPPLPEVARASKGDPFISLRPAFDASLRRDPGLQRLRLGGLVFGVDEAAVMSAFSASGGDAPGPDSVAHFEPWAEGESPTTRASRTDVSPRANGSHPTATGQNLARDGATPAVPRAVALSSATPVALQATPVEVLALATPARPIPGIPNVTNVPRASQPDFAALLDPAHAAREKKCLAEAVYFEARSESEAGQAAVAQVVLNRVNSGLYPSTVCGVVYQNRTHYNACQFSFACEGKSLRITEADPWANAVRIAEAVTSGETYSVGVGAATHYHANYVRPRWARQLKKMDVIGNHIFYRLRGSQG